MRNFGNIFPGRALGAVIGAYVDINESNIVESLKYVYRCMAGSAAIIAIIYFILYHGLLKPKCHAQNVQGTRQQPSVVQGNKKLDKNTNS